MPANERPDIRKYDEAMERKIVHLPPHLIEHAQRVGEGVLAQGVRKCIERDMDDE